MSSNRPRVRRHPVVVDIGCGCGRPKLSSLFSLTSTSKILKPSSPPSSTTTSRRWETSLTSNTTTTTSTSYEDDTSTTSPPSITERKKRSNIVDESVAVVKESWEPYLDFRDSMLDMIVEKEMYQWEDLRDLLHRLLALNSPDQHNIILRAFVDVCNGLFATPRADDDRRC